MWLKWLPWRYVIKTVARSQGYTDPIQLLTQLSRFAKPAEVLVPGELLRAGAVLQARGLINSQAIQHNLDWVWPYWVHRQFNPEDPAFIPRAFSLTHINLTHRNWTAVGLPGSSSLPVVDPRGLVMPFFDSWSLDAWIIGADGTALIPARHESVSQHLDFSDGLSVITRTEDSRYRLVSRSRVEISDGKAVLSMSFSACSKINDARLVISIRPYNPEGISFIHHVRYAEHPSAEITVNNRDTVVFHTVPDRSLFSDYHQGDVYQHLSAPENSRPGNRISCDIGMATAACEYTLQAGHSENFRVGVPLADKLPDRHNPQTGPASAAADWQRRLRSASRLHVPDCPKIQYLYEAALRTVILHSADTHMYAGPFTYKRFWIRDAVFAAHALMANGLIEPAAEILRLLIDAQDRSGYFVSQRGEWDSNGQVLWILHKYCELTGNPPDPAWRDPVIRACRWIKNKRITAGDEEYRGLLPPGFSAEHLGPNDCYYWDDFWSIAGLQSGNLLLKALAADSEADTCEAEAYDLMQTVENSLDKIYTRTGCRAIPASPSRRLDSGAVGSLIASYPLQLYRGDDQRMVQTASYLFDNCIINGAFFHDIVHSGINPYLTLHLAQALLRAGDMRCLPLMASLAQLASPTGQWPEAIHPQLKGGCMGDGQHVWAAAEWLMMVRSCFVREEPAGKRLILCSGIPDHWYPAPAVLRFGPVPTSFGPVSVFLSSSISEVTIHWDAEWHTEEPQIDIALPGRALQQPAPGKTSVTLPPENQPV